MSGWYTVKEARQAIENIQINGLHINDDLELWTLSALMDGFYPELEADKVVRSLVEVISVESEEEEEEEVKAPSPPTTPTTPSPATGAPRSVPQTATKTPSGGDDRADRLADELFSAKTRMGEPIVVNCEADVEKRMARPEFDDLNAFYPFENKARKRLSASIAENPQLLSLRPGSSGMSMERRRRIRARMC